VTPPTREGLLPLDRAFRFSITIAAPDLMLSALTGTIGGRSVPSLRALFAYSRSSWHSVKSFCLAMNFRFTDPPPRNESICWLQLTRVL